MENLLVVSNLILWVLVIGLGITVLALARQVGVLYERIAPAGALMVTQGPAVGEAAPEFKLETVSGETIALGGLSAVKKSTLLFFLSPTCPVCNTLIPILKSIQSSESKWLDIVFASDGDLGAQKAFIAKKEIASFPYVLSTQLGIAYQVAKLPFAVLVDENGVLRAKGLTNNREHLESLFSAMEHGVSSIQEFMSNRQKGAA
ncbi:MAG: methylamine dehydrogenase accessory protein MauD [Gammaproteobacteria bacterium]|jgi:methylamine dehydrogenase accessory protein MauD